MNRLRILCTVSLALSILTAVANSDAASIAQNIVTPPTGSTQDAEITKIDAYWYKGVTFNALGIGEVKAHQQAQAETARTDKQPGASPLSSGTTSLASKPGLTELITLAIEQGAIEKDSSPTSLTLRTSPYLVMTALGTKDTAEAYNEYWFWRMFEFHVSYPVSGENSNNFRAKEIVDWGGRIRLYGDRSPRSDKFQKLWQARVKPLIQQEINSITATESAVLSRNPELLSKIDDAREQTKAKIIDYMASSGDTTSDKIAKVQDLIDAGLQNITISARSHFQKVSAAKITELKNLAMGEKAQKELMAVIDEVAKSPLLTIEYLDQRNENSSDVSQLVLAYQSQVAPLDLIVNAKSSFYNDSNKADKSSSVKDYGGTIALEWKGNNFLFSPSDSSDMTQLTVTGSGAITHDEGASGVRGNAQLRVEIPLRKGITIPLALTYSTNSETTNKSEVRGNFGLTFDWSKMLASSLRF